MSIQAVGWVLDHSASRGFDRLVLIALANHAGDDRMCFPSQRTIASEAKVSKGSVSNAIEALVELGELEIVSIGDHRRSTRYRLTLSTGAHDVGTEVGRSAHSRVDLSAQSRGGQNHQEPSMTIRPCANCNDTRHVFHPTERNQLIACPECRPVPSTLHSVANLGGHE